MSSGNVEKNKGKAYMILVLMSLYVLSPVDFLPDIAPCIGNFDDLIVMLFSAKKAYPMLEAAA